MCRQWSRVGWVMCAMLAVGQLAAAADNKQKNDRDRQRDRQREQANRLEQQIREGQNRLNALQNQEKTMENQVRQFERELPGARERLHKAEAEWKEADRGADTARDALASARNQAKTSDQQADEVAKRVEEAQPADSPFGQARKAYLAAKAECDQLVEAIVNSAEYKAEYQRAIGTPRVATVRKEFIDGNPKVVKARETLLAAKAAYERLRDELVQKNPDWSRAAAALEKAKGEEDRLEKELRNLATKMGTLKRNAAKLQADVKGMETGLARDKDALKRIPGMRESLRREIERDRHELARLR